jgi:hypothetical protein
MGIYIHAYLLWHSGNFDLCLCATPISQKGALLKVISGGQTGVDRAALDAAIAVGFDYGGSIPLGRKAEDGFIDLSYTKLNELPRSKLRGIVRLNSRQQHMALERNRTL